ncbi:TetR/AcrR family transcriptional regulator [Arthrobacter castelli]|uniref:TetR/AcrR family transcriptional regulator n=1 Tax=Arthrobacter castelli TaxID=271431 RepID=UPI0004098DA9|nr:TetR family transcriptional regulator [Arthrobacter castelli]
MARPKNQTVRRNQLIEAAKRAIAHHGLNGLQSKDVAAEAGLSAGSVAYYYPDLTDLIRDVHQRELDRFYWERLHEVESAQDPRTQLGMAVTSGIPKSGGDIDYQVLNEMHVQAFRDPFHARLMANLFEREVSLYLSILDSGVRKGVFELRAPDRTVARNIVALEDAYGLHILGGSSVSVEQALSLLLTYVESAVGCELAIAAGS